MTDLELIELLREKSAGDLSSTEVDAIRARWTQSPDLRLALVEHLHLESQLTGALAPVHLDVDMILKRASEQQKIKPASSRWGWLMGLICCLIGVGTGLFVFFSKPHEPEQIVEHSVEETTITVDFPADASIPSNLDEPSAESVLSFAMGEKPLELQSSKPSLVVDPLPKPTVKDVAANEPWSASLARDVAPWGLDSPNLTAPFKSAGHNEFPDSEGKRWLAQVESFPYDWSTDNIGNPVRRISKFHGLAKLRAPWPDDALLRVTPLEVTDMTFYFWRGPTGIALRFYTRREPHLWAAFEIARENSSPKPTRFGLLSTDSGRYFRSTPGTFDVRQQNGELVLARGGIILLTAPFDGPPIEVYVEGQFRLRGLSMHRSVAFPNCPDNPHPALVSSPAAKIPWAISAESPASLVTNDDGCVSMAFDSREKTGLVCFPFGWLFAMEQSQRSNGLFEVIVKVESAEPGTGVYLGDRDGRPLQQVGFFKDSTTQRTTFGILRPGEIREESSFNPDEYPPPYLARTGWFKLISGLGTLHVQVSGDGLHWGHVIESPGRDLPGAVGSMGLFGLQGPTARTIRVGQVQVRELTGVTSLADPFLLSKVTPFKKDDWRDSTTWNHRVIDSLPQGVDETAWFTANAVAALSQGPPKELGLNLLRQLVKVEMRSTRTFEQKQRLLDDACSLCDLFDVGQSKTLSVWYEELGWQLAASHESKPVTKVRAAWLWSPIWTSGKQRNVWERLHSHEIIQAVYRRDWASAWSLSQSATFWNLLPHPDQRPTERGEELDRHARWAKAMVAEAVPQIDDGSAGVLLQGQRHPFAPVLNKEAYNLRAELESALSGQNYDDACRIVTSIAERDGPGLLPDSDDRQLYVSMSTAIGLARALHPAFVHTMSEKFEPLGQIRIRSAINRRDVASLQAAALQFTGTDASRNAHLSLGDLAMSVGQFESAEQHFHDALVDADRRLKEKLEPRLLIARALRGGLTASQLMEISSQIPAGGLDLNGTTISPVAYKSLMDEFIARSPTTGLITEAIRQPVASFPQAAFKLEARSLFDGHPGNNPGRHEYRFGDPFGRQLSVVSDDQRIYVSNRFQVNAYSVVEGRQLWAQGLGSEQGEAYALPFTPMKPLLTSAHMYVRRLTKAGAELACLKLDDGQVVWRQRPTHSVLTDPVSWNGQLFALTLSKSDEDFVQVEATWFDSAGGNVTSSRPLFRLRDASDRQFSGQMTLSDRIAVCSVSGTTASFDSRGEIRWTRRQTLIPKPTDELAEDQRVVAPVVIAGRVILTIPGVREVSCLELDSGRLVWSRPVTDLRGLLHVSNTRVLVDTVKGLVSLDVRSGEIAWQRSIESRLEAFLVDGPTLVCTRRVPFPKDRSKPVFVWVDLETGEELGQSLVETADREEVQLGPMFSAGSKWWSFVGQSWKEPKRELNELVQVPAVVPRSYVDESLQAWKPELPEGRLAEIELIVPGWFPQANYRERLVVHSGDIRGETAILVSKLDPLHSVRLSSRIHLVPGRKQALRLRVGNQPGQKWKLTIRTATQALFEQDIEDAGSSNGWRDVLVDLSPLTGLNVPLQLIQTSINNSTADALMKRVELIVE
jgi:outer membrane protein assembly factor BamB